MFYKITIKTTNKTFIKNMSKKFIKLSLFFKKAKKFITVIKSPFVFKKSRDQFFFQTYRYTFTLKGACILAPGFLESLLLYTFKNLRPRILRLKIIKEETSKTF